MIGSRCLSAALLLLIVKTAAADDDPTVETPLGKLRGHWLTSRAGRKYMAFSGVPYAKPPQGDLRFKAPVAAEQWTGIREAKKSLPTCMQYMYVFNNTGVEDCLYLSVYTNNVTNKAPVMVMLHGGAFILGTGNWTFPTYFMDEDVVVVIVNYRVGIFGFLTFETKDLPGNQGLKDQTMALKWVQQNIASFGGDPDKVTIHGYSAGGASVYHHYVSPLSKGLFHRGYAMSGTSYNPWALSPPGLARTNAEKLMKLLDCPTTPVEAIPCVMKKDAKEIVDKFSHFWVAQLEPMLTFSPVLEEPSPEAFLVSPVSKWEHNPAPLIISLSSGEGLSWAISLISRIKEFSDNFNTMAPISLHYWASASNPGEVTKKVREYYFPGKTKITEEDYVNVTHMCGDVLFNHGIIEGANKAKGDVYVLYVDYIPKAAIIPGHEKFFKIGAPHCTENVFLWELSMPFPPFDLVKTEKDLKISQDLVKAVVNFMDTGIKGMIVYLLAARGNGREAGCYLIACLSGFLRCDLGVHSGVNVGTHDPRSMKTPTNGSEWKTWTAQHNNYLHLDQNGYALKEGLLQEEFTFWDTVKYKDKFI